MIYLSKSVLIGLVHGKCKLAPDGTEIKALWALRELAVAQGGTEGVITWEELNRRRLAISTLPHQPAGSCSSCGTACLACNAAAPENQAIRMPKPARTPIVDTLAVVPVPPHKGDRHSSETVDVVWLPAKNLSVYISDGNLERANGLIRHVGTEADPDETADAVISCRDMGLSDATDTIISYAGSRSERDVLQIVRSLNQRDRRADADALLERALAGA
ncbi:hypothetical protein [Nocardia asiatica]